MWHSHPCFIFFLVTSCSSLVCPPRGSLPLKQPFKLTSLVGVHHNSHPLPLFAPSVLLPAAVLSRLSSLHIFGWAEFFSQLPPTSQPHSPLHPCFVLVLAVLIAGGCLWQLSFLLPSSAPTPQTAHYICSSPWSPPPLPSSYSSADLSLQTDAVFEQACTSSHQALLSFLVPDTIIAR